MSAKSKTTTRRKAAPKPKPVSLADVPQALAELALDVPYYDVRLVGNRLEFHLYGGQVRAWPADPEP